MSRISYRAIDFDFINIGQQIICIDRYILTFVFVHFKEKYRVYIVQSQYLRQVLFMKKLNILGYNIE